MCEYVARNQDVSCKVRIFWLSLKGRVSFRVVRVRVRVELGLALGLGFCLGLDIFTEY